MYEYAPLRQVGNVMQPPVALSCPAGLRLGQQDVPTTVLSPLALSSSFTLLHVCMAAIPRYARFA